MCTAGSRAPGRSAQCPVVKMGAGRIAVCCAWRRTPTGSSPRWTSGSARTPRDLSPDRSATPSPAPSGWPWSGHRSVIIIVKYNQSCCKVIKQNHFFHDFLTREHIVSDFQSNIHYAVYYCFTFITGCFVETSQVSLHVVHV